LTAEVFIASTRLLSAANSSSPQALATRVHSRERQTDDISSTVQMKLFEN